MAVAREKSLLHLLHRASQIGTERFEREMNGVELTARQLIILQAVAANEGASQTAIVDITGIDRSTLADVVLRLVKRHLLSRRRTKEDARAYALSLTDEGRRRMGAAEPILRKVEKDMLAVIPMKQRSELLQLLKALSAAP